MRSPFIFLLSFIIVFAACVPMAEPEPAAIDNQAGGGVLDVVTVRPRPSATPTVFQSGALLITDTPTPDPTVLTRTPWPPDPLPSPTPAPPFPGMVFTTAEGLWRVDPNWGAALLFEERGDLDENGRRLLYGQDGDIWLKNFHTDTPQNLTNSPDTTECCPQWWPDHPPHILYAQTDPATYNLRPVLYHLETQETLSFGMDQSEITGYAPLPGNSNMAITTKDSALFYDSQGNSQVFQALLTNFPEGSQIHHVGSPSWSKNGDNLALIIQGDFPGESASTALLILGFEWQTIGLFYLGNAGETDIYSPPLFNPLGEWMVFQKSHLSEEINELHVINIDGIPDPIVIERATHPLWSPDGRYLIYKTDEGTFLTYPPEFTYKIGITVPEDATVIDWQTP